MESSDAIRDARTSDLPGIFAIYDHEVREGTATFDTEIKTPEQRIEWLAAHQTARYPALVAIVNGEVAGWATLSPWSPRRAYDRTAEDSVYIHHDHHRRGLGRALMNELIARAARHGIHVILARTCEESTASIALHDSLGFVNVGTMRRVGTKFGRLLDVRILQLNLA